MNRFWLQHYLLAYATGGPRISIVMWGPKNKYHQIYRYPPLPNSPLEMAEGILYTAAGLRPAWLSVGTAYTTAFIRQDNLGAGTVERQRVIDDIWISPRFYTSL